MCRVCYVPSWYRPSWLCAEFAMCRVDPAPTEPECGQVSHSQLDSNKKIAGACYASICFFRKTNILGYCISPALDDHNALSGGQVPPFLKTWILMFVLNLSAPRCGRITVITVSFSPMCRHVPEIALFSPECGRGSGDIFALLCSWDTLALIGSGDSLVLLLLCSVSKGKSRDRGDSCENLEPSGLLMPSLMLFSPRCGKRRLLYVCPHRCGGEGWRGGGGQGYSDLLIYPFLCYMRLTCSLWSLCNVP